jgi:predicted unusual protein kinase regulating ubiquinone biosynthesis (AarF/ABC1/UbiB family)
MRFGLMAGEFAAGGLAESARRMVSSDPEAETSAFLTARSARKLAERLSHMRGATMKLGQLLSMEGGDVLPSEFAEALAVLRARADSMPTEQLRRLLGREYGKGWRDRFADFDYQPMASASIGQVHYARSNDGRHMALKIQYPGVARSINSDVDNVAVLLRMLNLLPVELDVSGLVAEAKKQLRKEADYLQEASNLSRYRDLVAGAPRLWVPAVQEDFTTRHILAMDFADGNPIDDLADPGTPQALRNQVGYELERLMFRELFEFRFMQTDPNFANYLYDFESDRIELLDLGSARSFSTTFTRRYALISRAIIAGDREGVRRHAVEIGYLHADDPHDQVQATVDLILLVCEPLRHSGPYDFGSSDLPQRARELGLDLAFSKGFLRAPPAETVFLHRKLVGSYLLCARIRARVDVQALILPYTDSA